MVTDRLVELKRKLSEQSKFQIDALLEEQAKLQKLKAAVEGGLEKQNGWIMGQEMERKERETNVEEVTSTVLVDFEQQTKPLDMRDLIYTRDDDKGTLHFVFKSDRILFASVWFKFPIVFLVIISVNQFIASIGNVHGQPNPPVVTLSHVSSTQVKIQLSSEHEKEKVLYSIRYRKVTAGDDEKEEEWRDLDFAENADNTTISTEAATTYDVYGKYLLNESLQSEKCFLQFTSMFEFNGAKKSKWMSLHLGGRQFSMIGNAASSIASKTVSYISSLSIY